MENQVGQLLSLIVCTPCALTESGGSTASGGMAGRPSGARGAWQDIATVLSSPTTRAWVGHERQTRPQRVLQAHHHGAGGLSARVLAHNHK